VSVAVYPRLDELLRERNLTVADLKRQIQERYGLELDSKILDRLARPDPVQRTDLTVAGAAAKVLGVGLGDLFAIEAVPVDFSPLPEDDYLDEDQTQRMWALLDLQDERPLSADEERELRALVDEYGRRFTEYHLRAYAEREGIPLEQVRREAEERIARASAWWQEIEANPRRRRAFVARAKRRIAASKQ
jgi:hypothetical protein